MTRFGKTSLIWLLAGSLAAAAGAVAWRVASVGAQQAREALVQVDRSEADLAALKARLMQWEKAHPPGSTKANVGALRIEPVALSADFAPREFAGIGPALAGMYDERGSLTLKSFTLEVGAGGTAHVAVLGDKVFVQ